MVDANIVQVRRLAVLINSSPQRRETFLNLQTARPQVLPIRDVRTRWNSTFLMLIRALRLRSTIEVWVFQERNSINFDAVQLGRAACDQVRYLMVLLRPFYIWTEITSKTTAVSVNKAWTAYTGLFEHLELAESKLICKTVSWKYTLADSVVAAHQKLAAYYSKTYGPGGDLYNWATILDPMQKLESYKLPSFRPEDLQAYEKSFRAEYRDNYSVTIPPAEAASNPGLLPGEIDFADLVLTQQQTWRHARQRSPLDSYLQSSTTSDRDILRFWQQHETDYPGLAHMARDVLAVPISGAGVERYFSAARLICSYQRN